MTAYIVCYDLQAPGKNYQPLYDKIKSYSIWARVTESNWVIVTEKTATELRDDLMTVIDDNDRLFVVKSGRAAAWHNVRCRNEWLKARL